MAYITIICMVCGREINYRHMSDKEAAYYKAHPEATNDGNVFNDGDVLRYLTCVECCIERDERKEREATES